MRDLDCRRWALLIALCVFLGSRFAQAQDTGYQLNRLAPAPAGDPFALVDFPQFSSKHWLATRLTFDYAKDSVVLAGPNGSGAALPAPIGHTQYARFSMAGTWFGRLGLTLELPFLLFERGTVFRGIGPSAAVVSDPRVGVRGLLFGSPTDALSMSVSLDVWMPVGSEGNLAGDNKPRFLPKLIVGGVGLEKRARWAINAGYYKRSAAVLSSQLSPIGNTVGSEVRLAAGASYLAPGGKFSVGPELTLALAVDSQIPREQGLAIAEIFATGRYAITDEMTLGLGVGTAVAGSPGPPPARALLTFNYSPSRHQAPIATASDVLVPDNKEQHVADASIDSDGDGDGVADKDDACPERPGQASTDALRNGCPPSVEKIVVLPDEDGHVGAVEVDDGTSIILVDKAYASAEISSAGKAVAVAPASSEAVERAISDIAKVLPPADVDQDGVRDSDDVCPGRKGEASSDPLRNGCPPASERVVVLPDANGHVGAVEVDDGTTKTVLDKAFATSEVGSDGYVHSVPASPSTVVMRSLADITAVLPKADADGDGIVDANDACQWRKGLSNVDPDRHGCPLVKETIVLLEDADGHVGAVEVGEGASMIVLDKAFATAEIAEDGGVVKARSAKRDVDAAFADVLSTAQAAKNKVPTSAGRVQFTVYFDEKAVPTRDVDLQIAALMRELSLLDDYSIEVVGHTDATGSNRANLRVGLARANAIAKRLEAEGVPTRRVGASTRGSSEPAVVVINPLQVPEKLNRRVEIRIKAPGLAQLVVPYAKGLRTTRDMKGEYKALGKRLKGLSGYKIAVVGHTDGTETEQNLAQKRALKVARQLRKAGIPRGLITVVSKDATDPAVKEHAGVPEPSNRRVEIFIDNK